MLLSWLVQISMWEPSSQKLAPPPSRKLAKIKQQFYRYNSSTTIASSFLRSTKVEAFKPWTLILGLLLITLLFKLLLFSLLHRIMAPLVRPPRRPPKMFFHVFSSHSHPPQHFRYLENTQAFLTNTQPSPSMASRKTPTKLSSVTFSLASFLFSFCAISSCSTSVVVVTETPTASGSVEMFAGSKFWPAPWSISSIIASKSDSFIATTIFASGVVAT
ncbi:uncharacterized protein G2W53_009358 [Senna tora]|uniref:Uncharacterized protein n=1 Tax=Senna tora TaxID=362788 RepID=A0A834WYA9_9FABA|nr:uncharacterized protein G2W53_009358 [Senna tora]